MDSRGIITVELIFASIILLVIIGGILSVASERMDSVSSTEELGKARMATESVAEAINKVYSGGNGHAVTLNLPATINKKEYNLKVNSSGVFILIDGNIGKSTINPKKISCTDELIQSNVIMHGDGKYLIKNVKGSDGNNWIVIQDIESSNY
jgi:hypothetical protein